MAITKSIGPLAIALLGVMTGNAALSLDMYLPAFPIISEDFGVTESAVLVTLSSFLLGFAVGQLIYGPLSDRFGRRIVTLTALIIYGLISVLCATSNSIDDFSFYRVIQGFAGASGSVLGRAIIRDIYDGTELTKAMSMLMLILTVAPMSAPMLGSLLLEFAGWRSIFWTLSAYACLWSLLIYIFIPETLPPERRVSLHPVNLASSFKSVLLNRTAMGYCISAGLGFAGMFAYIAETPFLYINLFGISPQKYAILFAANIVGMAISTSINRYLSHRFSVLMMMTIITRIMVISATVLMFNCWNKFGGIWGMAIPLFFYVGSLSAMAANGISGTLQLFGNIAGTASSIFGLFQFGLGALAGLMMSYVHNGSTLPLAWVILFCALASAATLTMAHEKPSEIMPTPKA